MLSWWRGLAGLMVEDDCFNKAGAIFKPPSQPVSLFEGSPLFITFGGLDILTVPLPCIPVPSIFEVLWLSPKAACLKLLKAIMTTVTLSTDLLKSVFLRMYSTPIPLCLWTLFAALRVLLSFTLFHTHSTTSLFDILSNMPSQPKTMKSWCVYDILKVEISGVAITTWRFPPRLGILASASPKVLDTESLPGRTLNGPIILC